MDDAVHKWLQLIFDIVSYEFDHGDDGQLLSEGADRLVMKHPVLGRIVIVATGTIITLHLANLINDRYDLMCKDFWRNFGSVSRRPGRD